MSDFRDRVIIDDEVINCLEYLQDDDTTCYFETLLSTCIDAAIDQPDLFEDDTALDIIRGLHTLRKALRSLNPASAAIPPAPRNPLTDPPHPQ